MKQRQQQQLSIDVQIDRLIGKGKRQQDETVGCGSGICPFLAKKAMQVLGLSRRRSQAFTAEMSAASASASVLSGHKTGFFGTGSNKDANSKLKMAAEAMRARLHTLEARAQECRSAAANQIRVGHKTAALRELKRAKVLEKQAFATTSAMDALESQSDMLEQTAMQREVAAALGATAKTLKKDKTMLSKAEDAVDAAAEMRDLHEDMTQIMAGLGEQGGVDEDEDELLSELKAMIADEPPPQPVQYGSEAGANSERVRYKEELEKEHSECDEVRRLRAKMPEVPNGSRSTEKQSLLSSSVGA